MSHPTVEVQEIHYWAVVMKFSDGDEREFPERFASQHKADSKLEDLVSRGLVSKATPSRKYFTCKEGMGAVRE